MPPARSSDRQPPRTRGARAPGRATTRRDTTRHDTVGTTARWPWATRASEPGGGRCPFDSSPPSSGPLLPPPRACRAARATSEACNGAGSHLATAGRRRHAVAHQTQRPLGCPLAGSLPRLRRASGREAARGSHLVGSTQQAMPCGQPHSIMCDRTTPGPGKPRRQPGRYS